MVLFLKYFDGVEFKDGVAFIDGGIKLVSRIGTTCI